jgi:hypothetical protein
MNKTLKNAVRLTFGKDVIDNIKTIEQDIGTCSTVNTKTTVKGKLELVGIFGEDKILKKVAERANGKFV